MNHLEIREQAKAYGLDAPESYWNVPEEELSRYCGGCGPGKWGDLLVPDEPFGIPFTSACHIHDWEWGYEDASRESNIWFLSNMLTIIEKEVEDGGRRLGADQVAWAYYCAVEHAGSPFEG